MKIRRKKNFDRCQATDMGLIFLSYIICSLGNSPLVSEKSAVEDIQDGLVAAARIKFFSFSFE